MVLELGGMEQRWRDEWRRGWTPQMMKPLLWAARFTLAWAGSRGKALLCKAGETLHWQEGGNETKSTKPLVFKEHEDRTCILTGYQQVVEEGGKGKGYECFCCHEKDTNPSPTSKLHTVGVSTPDSRQDCRVTLSLQIFSDQSFKSCSAKCCGTFTLLTIMHCNGFTVYHYTHSTLCCKPSTRFKLICP